MQVKGENDSIEILVKHRGVCDTSQIEFATNPIDSQQRYQIPQLPINKDAAPDMDANTEFKPLHHSNTFGTLHFG